MKKFAVIVAAGKGERMGNTLPKQFLPVLGKPVLWHTLKAFLDAYPDLRIILVLPEAHLQKGQEVVDSIDREKRIQVTTGGKTRFHSVRNGLKSVEHPSIVFAHDGVRCLVSPRLIQRCYREAVEKGSAVPAIAATDSVRIESATGNVTEDRNKVRLVQTPQTFESRLLQTAFEQEYTPSFTDEASVVEKLGKKINLIEGESTNIKITKPLDLLIAEAILRAEESSADR